MTRRKPRHNSAAPPMYTLPSGGGDSNYSGNNQSQSSYNTQSPYSAQPSSYNTQPKRKLGNENKSMGSSGSFTFPPYIVFLIVVMLSGTIYTFSIYSGANTELKRLQSEKVAQDERMRNNSRELQRAKHPSRQAKRMLEWTKKEQDDHIKQINELEDKHEYVQTEFTQNLENVELDQHKAVEKVSAKEVAKCFQREEVFRTRVEDLRHHIQRESRRELVENFGTGPHRVRLTIIFPDNPKALHIIELEMAPFRLLPHSIYTFMEQVRHGLWDGCSFSKLVDGKLIVSPTPSTLGTLNEKDLKLRFAQSKLDIVYFQEYHAKFPHVEMTVGFDGRPGGPDFYINMVDNTLTNGPGGMHGDVLFEDPDPCFAKVVVGHDIVRHIAAKWMTNKVHIKSATIIPVKDNSGWTPGGGVAVGPDGLSAAGLPVNNRAPDVINTNAVLPGAYDEDHVPIKNRDANANVQGIENPINRNQRVPGKNDIEGGVEIESNWV